MLDVDNFNPLNRFLLKKDQQQVLADQDPSRSDPNVVPIKPPRLRRAPPLRHFSVTQLLLVPVVLSGIYFYVIARDRYVTRSDFVIRKAEDNGGAPSGSGLAKIGRAHV